MVYELFGELYKHLRATDFIQKKVKERWDFLSTECTGISYMINPKLAAEGFYLDNDRTEIFNHVNQFLSARHPGLGHKAEEEAMTFVSDMTQVTGPNRDSTFKMGAKRYWNILGKLEYSTLYKCAKEFDEMICSSAASERAWSIYHFVHTRLRNRLNIEKAEMAVYHLREFSNARDMMEQIRP